MRLTAGVISWSSNMQAWTVIQLANEVLSYSYNSVTYTTTASSKIPTWPLGFLYTLFLSNHSSSSLPKLSWCPAASFHICDFHGFYRRVSQIQEGHRAVRNCLTMEEVKLSALYISLLVGVSRARHVDKMVGEQRCIRNWEIFTTRIENIEFLMSQSSRYWIPTGITADDDTFMFKL